jgi:hypothetical protein
MCSLTSLDGVLPLGVTTAPDEAAGDFAARVRLAQRRQTVVKPDRNPLFDALRRRIGDPAAYARVERQLKNYNKYFQARGPVQRQLLARSPRDVVDSIESMLIYSNMPPHKARRMAFTRCLTTMDWNRYTPAVNLAVLGNAHSLARTNAECILPGNQVSLEMRSPFKRNDGRIVRPVILSLPAPDLSTLDQPEWPHYVDSRNRLREEPYRHALETLWGHIRSSSKRHPDHRVVLSAFGMVNFIKGLPPGEQERAKAHAAEIFARSIAELQGRGVEVAFTDVEEDAPFWTEVNRLLPERAAVPWVGTLPGRWLRNKDILVNAWDPESTVGNGCEIDNSIDGHIGRRSLTHEASSTACILYQNGVLDKVANIPVLH